MTDPIVTPISNFIQQVGFPIAVALWLLWRTDKRLDKIAELIGQIAITMATIEKVIDSDGG